MGYQQQVLDVQRADRTSASMMLHRLVVARGGPTEERNQNSAKQQ
jgi:hypothetical protein